MEESGKNDIIGEIVEISRKLELNSKQISTCEAEIKEWERRLDVLKEEKERFLNEIDELYSQMKE